ncbi:ABC transporter ATP-binding protein [Sphingomonas spermidinifaciens]|uniref:ABC transporter ATP-binding protein n=1 Tax=Sphingomonas spermidinifaciens TaxID=1141889 RepID=A0A2A4B8H5_9SPHN|nr:ATP-binding cassette domain-containing protein [Sphingomonas spermidinifaciens]PCD04387.1 ABC transporter ATP-binding protein [Sphingomonas spermidinifaciens]
MPAPPRLAFEGVTKAYGAMRAVDDVTLAIEPGQFVALVGQSGSGKSTLLKTVNRLIEPDAGRVTIDGADVSDGPAPALRRRIGYVFQNVGLFPHLTVAENIAMPQRIGGAPVDVAARLDQVELPRELASRSPAQLSGGQRQRVGLARALAGEAKLLLMDEPFGALDPLTRDALGRRVRGLHDQLGLTTLLVTHDMAEALLLADRVLVMDAGRIVADATPAELLAGRGGSIADALVAVPREQARALAAMDRE